MRPRFTRALVIAIAFAAAACSSGPDWPTAADRYVPASIGGDALGSSAFAESIGPSIVDREARGSAVRAYGRPTGSDPLPDGLVIAVTGSEDAVGRTLANVTEDLAGRPRLRRTTATADVAVDTGVFRQGEREIAVAVARPAPGVGLAAMSFDGDPDGARGAVDAMLRSATDGSTT